MPDDVEVGEQLQMTQTDGSVVFVIVIEVSETTVTIDANHPLAGQDLTFKIELPIYQTSKQRYINSLLKISLKNGLKRVEK